MEDVTKKVKEFIEKERKSNQTERMLVADVLDDILDDNGSSGLMESSMHEFIDAAISALKFIRGEENKLKLSESPKLKRFRIELAVRYFNGQVETVAEDPDDAENQVWEDISNRELIDGCEDSKVEMEAVYEIDEKGKEISGTRRVIE
jgi:hypothetical protein